MKNWIKWRGFIFGIVVIGINGLAQAARVDVDIDDDGLIEIYTAEELNAMRLSMDGSSFHDPSDNSQSSVGCFGDDSGTTACQGFELMNDIDFDSNQNGQFDTSDPFWNAGQGWEPIGTFLSRFNAIFDGNFNRISNVTIHRPVSSGVGLFGYTDTNIEIRQLILDQFSVTAMDTAGMLAGWQEGGIIEKIQIKNAQLTLIGFENLAGVSGGASGGALIGVGKDGFISQVSVAGHLSCFYQCGGIAGTLQDHSINDSSSSTIVYNGDSDASGLVGALSGSSTVNRSFAFGKVFGLKSAWGIAKGGVINQSYWGIQATAQTTGSDGTLNDSEGLNTYELHCPTGPDDITCKPGSTLYDGWDEAIWNFGTENDFPKLQWILDLGDLIYQNGFDN